MLVYELSGCGFEPSCSHLKVLCWIRNVWDILKNRIQSKDHKIGTSENSKISLSWFDDKKYIQNNWYDGLPLGY